MKFIGDMGRFDKFTEHAKKVLSLAQEEAQLMWPRKIGSEHILLGLLREGEDVGARILQNMGVDLARAREAVKAMVVQDEQEQPGAMRLNAEGRKVIEQAVDEARRLNHHYVGTEHILLALVGMPESAAGRVLWTLGIAVEEVRTYTVEIMSQSSRYQDSTTAQRAERSTEFMWHMRKMSDKARDRDRFDRFDEQARKILALAQEEAQRFQHNYIGTEHLLLGLVRLGDSTAGRVLNSLGVELDKVRDAVEFIIGRGDRIVLGEIGLTPRAKKVIELAVDEAHRLEHDYIGTEHLLLGLVREGQGIAAGVLESLGVKLHNVRKAVLDVVGRGLPLIMLASAYVRGEKQFEERASGVQDADDLVPEPASAEERGNAFTIRARRVLVRAREEALQSQRDVVGTDHLLLALIREQNGLAFHVLRNLGIELERIQTATHFLIAEENLREPGNADGFTDDGKKALELTIDESRLLDQTAIGTEHLLLGLIRCEGMASGILITRGLTLEKARAETRRLLGL